MPSKKVFLVRHCASAWNDASCEERRTLGAALRDAGLSARGALQQDALREARHLLPPDAVVFSSPLARARATADAFGRPVTVVPALREVRRDIADVPCAGGAAWSDPDCSCPDLHECAACVARRVWDTVCLIAGCSGTPVLVTHSDFLLALCGWDAMNGEIGITTLTWDGR